MLGVNQVSLFIFLGVYVTRQIKHIISRLIFHFLGDPWPLRLSLELSLGYNCGFTKTCGLGFALLLPTGIPSSGVLGDWFVLATAESVFFLAVSVLSSYFHYSSQGHVPRPTEFQVKLSVPNALLESTNRLVW